MTATSVVPPPMSTTMLAAGSATGRSAPIAAAIGSSMRRVARAGGERRLLDGPPLDLGDPARHAENDARVDEAAADRPADEVPEHLLGHLEVGDDAVAERPGRTDRRRGAPDHAARLRADREHLPRDLLDGDNRRLEENDPLAADEDDRVRGPQIDGDLAAVAKRQVGARAGKARWCAHPLQRPSKAGRALRTFQSVLVDDRVRHREFEAGERLLGKGDDPDLGVPATGALYPSGSANRAGR